MIYTASNLLKRNKVYITRYITYRVERLGHQYDTNCLDYGPESEFVTRHDCIKSCYTNNLNRICNGTALVNFGFLMQTGPNNTIYKPCPIQWKVYMHIYDKCIKTCQMNCHETYYSQRFDVETENANETAIIITKDWKTPDLTIRYIPEISFTSFVSNFGGLVRNVAWSVICAYNEHHAGLD